ncbi:MULTISPECIES: glucose-6-phosphate isomerase family protein [unclassified Dysgonomonas]|uniref:glucose-6-phosphate isomerase family protein n=1 Tax=unclassified Dysgonomonas TaxID=2630389 RepID=UPI0013EABD42|nr:MULTISPECIES: glucose-6-phosphate isomerase family protein [unclassified Dysgonomonas]
MSTSNIINPALFFADDNLIGDKVEKSVRRMKDLKGIFQDEAAFLQIQEEKLVYEVSSFLPVKEGTPGGLYFGITYLYPGKVGDEYFMTKGHFHANIDRAEFYWGLKGEGMLIFMDEQRKVWAERMFPGSLHYIPGGIAHRVANTGNQMLSFGACWPSDAGHNYEEIAQNGFACRLVDRNGVPNLI